MQENFDPYYISTDKEKLQLLVIHRYLATESYWAKNIPIEVIAKSIENSFCFGLYLEGVQIGFARVVTDYATFGYLADVFILEAHRGKGLSKWLMEFIFSHDKLQGLRRFCLGTRDAHGLYKKFGFTRIRKPEFRMEIKHDNFYTQTNG